MTRINLNPVQRADLVAILSMTLPERRVRVASAFLGLDVAGFMKACGIGTPHAQRFLKNEAFRLKVAAALDIPYSQLWEAR